MSSDTEEATLEPLAPGEGFLGDLGPSIPSYPYEGRQQFVQSWETEIRRQQEDDTFSDVALFTGVDPETFNRDFVNSTDQNITQCWKSYDGIKHLLLTRAPISMQDYIRYSSKKLSDS
ncbi:hypothetical protein NUU61_000656 [Penicillium alfredii]|uniref:Uncharacterized protein n=1 Tax=Penicillium alfredii TaxID=1506179 RepID=A0A9W9GAC6_9EURO|nr:uncharacterized protein NUU61_000656 [Penicillium alfredii]KAJ5114897.1 hypothetical protein NUU61_000656 [Penicillium alfredii]